MFSKILCILGFSLGLLSLTATQVSAQGRSCSEQTIRDVIQVVEEYPRARTSDDNNLAFRVYQLGIINYVARTLEREFCSVGGSPAPKFKITIVHRPFFEPAIPQPTNPVVLTTEGRTLKTPWVQIAQNDKVFEAIYFFNERQVIYDQAKIANPALPINMDLRSISGSEFLRTYIHYFENGTIMRLSFRELAGCFSM
jgi:hypothetical protein